MRTRLLTTTLLLLVPLAAACSDDNTSNRAGLSSSDDYSVAGALEELPASVADDSTLILTGDLAAASKLSGVDRPDSTKADALGKWAGSLSGMDGSPVFVPLPGLQTRAIGQTAEFEAELGWSIADVDTFVEQATPPGTFTVVSGDFDADTLSPDLADLDGGLVTAGEGEDLSNDLAGATVARPTGAPLRLAQDAGRIAYSPDTGFVREWLGGSGRTMGDDETLAAVAEALDEQDVVSAVLSKNADGYALNPGGRMTPEQGAELMSGAGALLPDEAFDAVGIGWGVEDGESRVAVVYHFASTGAAKEAAPQLEKLYTEGDSVASRRPLSDMVGFREASPTGQTVTVTLDVPEGAATDIAYRMLVQRDLPFAHR